MNPEEYKECLDLLNAWFEYDYQDYAGQGSFARARWAIKKLAKCLDLEVISVKYNREEKIYVEDYIKQLEHIIEVAEKLDGEEEISEPQPHHRLWSIVAGNRATMKQMAEDNKQLREQLEKTQMDMHANAHVVLESGIMPGETCRCEECKIVAKAMDEAGYYSGKRWWDEKE